MSNEENKISNRNGIITYLINAKKLLKEKFGDSLSNIYMYGSLVNDQGRGFNIQYSDIDLIVVTPLNQVNERKKFLMNLKESFQKLEDELVTRVHKRKYFPIINLCVITQFELDEGIHKNRNSLNAFTNHAFQSLESEKDISAIQIGKELKEDLVGIHFPAWAILTEVQEIRSNFINPKSSTKEVEKQLKGFQHRFLALPKELLRNAYLFKCYKEQKDPEMIVEDDIAKGLDAVKKLLAELLDKDKFVVELIKIIETNVPGGKNPGAYINLEQLVFIWELLSIETEMALRKRRGSINTETLAFAAPIVISELIKLKKTSLEAVDKAISLYENKYLLQGGLLLVDIRPHKHLSLYEFSNFDRGKLIDIIDDWTEEDIKKYLSEQFDTATKDIFYQCKVGFAGISFSHLGMTATEGVIQQASLSVRPLNYWILDQFNLKIAREPGSFQLRRLREKYGCNLFTSKSDYQCNFPSGLYIEAAIVTKEKKVPKISKNPRHSVLAEGKGSSVFTCGFEHGFTWHAHLMEAENNTWLNVEQALMEGLKKELSVEPSEVTNWEVTMLAIQHVHLNASLLGVVYLNISEGTLGDRIRSKSNEHFQKDVTFLSIYDAKAAISKDRGSNEWHQTALMRIHLIK